MCMCHNIRVSIQVFEGAPTLVRIISTTSTTLSSLISTVANRAVRVGGVGRLTLLKLHSSSNEYKGGGE